MILKAVAGLVILGELRRISHRQLIQAAHVPATGEQQTRLCGDQRPQALCWGRVGTRQLIGQLQGRLDGGIEQRQENLRLGRKVIVQRRLTDAHRVCNLVRGRGSKTLSSEKLGGGVQNLLTGAIAPAPRTVFTRPTDIACHAVGRLLSQKRIHF